MKPRFNTIIFPFVVFIYALFNSPQRAFAATDVITISFSNTLTPSDISGAITPELSNRFINVNSVSGTSSISDMLGATDSSAVHWNYSGTADETASHNVSEGYLLTSRAFGGEGTCGNNLWFTGLAANSKYTIYVYSQSSMNGAKTEINYSGNGADTHRPAGILTTNTSTTGYVNNGNYLTITTNADKYGRIAVNYSALTVSPGAVVNAVQIKSGDPASTPAPERATAVYMGINGILTGMLMR